jgi:membrane protein implicated in regulation of membrane protease activity
LLEDALALARAEVRLGKARAYDLLRRSRVAILLLGCALLLVQGAVAAAMLGFVLALTPVVGPAWAGLILFVAALLLAALLGWLALRYIAGPSEKPETAPEAMEATP